MRRLLMAILFLSVVSTFSAQVSLKTNLLSDATLSPDLGLELPLHKKWSLDISGNFNGWTVDGHRWRHWIAQPELRYWLCERSTGHFFGLHIFGGQYNVGNIDMNFKLLGTDFSKLKDSRYQGWYGGAGIAYGYTWILSRHWSMEAEIGIGWSYTRYDKFRCADCGKKIESDEPHSYFGVTKGAVNLVYVF